jgi:transcriptional regulator
MYTPSSFKVDDREVLISFMRQYSFATLITHDGNQSHAIHVPVLVRSTNDTSNTLFVHLARANPQCKLLEVGYESLIIFTGPHAYISPAWYKVQPSVPTWNYTAVHAYGTARQITDDAEFIQLLSELVEFYEAPRGDDRWDATMPQEYQAKMMQAIAGFEIKIDRIEGKFKLNQNRSMEDIQSVIEALSSSPHENDRETARMMTKI